MMSLRTALFCTIAGCACSAYAADTATPVAVAPVVAKPAVVAPVATPAAIVSAPTTASAVAQPASAVATAANVAVGKKCFDQFVAWEAQYDPKSVEMISSNALIEFTETAPDGTSKKDAFPVEKYKKESIAALPELKQNQATETYKNVSIVPEGRNFRISGMDYSSQYKVESPFSILLGLDPNENCTIYELKMTVAMPAAD